MHTGRFELVGLTRSFHGLLAGIASVNFSMAHAGYGPLLPGAFAVPAPYAYRCPVRHCDGACDCTCLEAGFELLDEQSVGSLCAFVAEPVLSAGGIIVPPDGYFGRARELCDERGMLLVLDEAQTGFGRLGMMFGFEHDGVVPDLVAVSKTLGGGFPLAATITSGAIEEDCVRKGFLHVTSHVSDPLPAAAGLAVLDVIEEEGLVGQARQRGDYLLGRLGELQTEHEQIGDVRGRGLLVGLELVEERTSRRPANALGAAVTEECLRRGLSMNIVRAGSSANCFRMAPPLTRSARRRSISASRFSTQRSGRWALAARLSRLLALPPELRRSTAVGARGQDPSDLGSLSRWRACGRPNRDGYALARAFPRITLAAPADGVRMLVCPSSQRTRTRGGSSWSTSSITPARLGCATFSDSTTILSPA
jgi:4-aminobutyrate aminotransferase-like enzyme